MMFDEFYGSLEIMAYNLSERNIPLDEAEVVYTKSSGENIIALVKDDEIIDYLKW